ncbi:hypothetical protein EDD27_3614 [Nonomuraea polychroma]|uniref:Uncharacterized protein n=1 Tax=Nonomuraea polychroma TaxID=46176 RepID=A0A438M5M1_9ACTN|nr:hypothetical protein [Nonomuraea polychroma]RVX41144.1 hypothetical protein EDD27_3614 [Nonomuraea polychroma]
MNRIRAELRAAAQVLVEIFTPQIWVRWWSPSIRIDSSGADERVAAVRAGTRKAGR